MPLKTEDGTIIEGKLTWVGDDGKETPVEIPALLGKINELNSEAASRRRKIGDLETKLEVLKDIEDPKEFIEKALENAEKLKDIDLSKMIDKGELDKVKAGVEASYKEQLDAAVKGLQAQLDESNAALEKTRTDYHNEVIGGSFARSEFISDKTVMPPEMMRAQYGRHFEVRDGKLIGIDHDGNDMYSLLPEKAGDFADFDECLERIVSGSPFKSRILKSEVKPGAGTPPGGPGGGGGGHHVRSLQDLRTDADKAAFVAEHGLEEFKKLPLAPSA